MPKRSLEVPLAKTKKKVAKVTNVINHDISFEELENFSSGEESYGSPDQLSSSSSSSSFKIESLSDSDESVTANNNSNPITCHDWKKVHAPEPDKNIQSKFSVSKTGPCNIENCKSPIDFLNLFLSESVFITMVHHSNAYAKHRMEKETITKASRLKYWRDITVAEMKKFISILITMGVARRPSLADYWSTKPSQFTPFYCKAMSLQRFQLIHSMFHLTGNLSTAKNSSEHESCKNVRELLTALNNSFKYYFIPGQEISVFESGIGSKKHHTYLKNVPAKNNVHHNVKKIDLCDSSSGYVFHSSLIKYKSRRVASLIAKRVVVEVLNEAKLTGKGYHIFTDNSYTSYGLSRELLTANTFLTGIVNKKSNGLKPTTTQLQLKGGKTLYLRKGDHLMVEYKKMHSKKSVYMITTGANAEDKFILSKKGKEKVVPLSFYLYHKQKVMMDRKHKSFNVTCSRMSRVCWKRIVYNLIDITILNAFILYKATTARDKRISRLQFILDVVEKLAFQDDSIESHVVENTHKPVLLPGFKTRFCEVCQKKSRFFCPCCNAGIHLQCFQNLNHYVRARH